ncbi:unnamed protein product [Paramecium pentaurelia]|uniref:Transmembrane protein n=1 Tax=Paramecium pentaurelia TaxID=43138 RepID=A0A8S1WNQ0_9CILI|nr:unnamed protein product [Paramecium pentaurelia]
MANRYIQKNYNILLLEFVSKPLTIIKTLIKKSVFLIQLSIFEYLNQTMYYQYNKLQFSKKLYLATIQKQIIFLLNIHFKLLSYHLMNILQIAIQQFKSLKMNLRIFNMNSKFTYQINTTQIFSINQMKPFWMKMQCFYLQLMYQLNLQFLNSDKISINSFQDFIKSWLLYDDQFELQWLFNVAFGEVFINNFIIRHILIKLEYPQNIYIYFESSNFIALQPFLNFLNFPDLNSNIFQNSFNRFDVLNFFVCTFCLLLYVYENIFRNIFFQERFSIIFKNLDGKLQDLFLFIYINLKRRTQKLKGSSVKKLLLNLFMQKVKTQCLKLVFLISNKKSEIQYRVSLLICFVYLGNIILISFLDLKNIWQQNYISFSIIIRKVNFIQIILFSFSFNIIQILSYTVKPTNITSQNYFNYFDFRFQTQNKINTINKIQLLAILSNEIPIVVFTLLNISDENFQIYQSLNKQIQIVFAQIGLLIFFLICLKIISKLYLSVIINGNNLNKEKAII